MESSIERARRAEQLLGRTDPFWPAQLTVLAAVLMYFALPAKLTLHPTWLLPVLEGVVLAGLVAATPHPRARYHPGRRYVAMALIGLVSAVNAFSLVLLVHYLVAGGKTGGNPLLVAGAILWLTNVLLFALWYWELDRGGPIGRLTAPPERSSFLFPQMTDPKWAPADWRPEFLDYLYVSLTNATAFSPTDTMPLTRSAKSLMGFQSVVSLVTVGLVVARAVNILS